MKLMPQEIEVWYIIPTLRRELARIFINVHHLSQKDAAALLGVTEAAVSHYVKLKRATEFKLPKEFADQIKKTAEKILADKENAMKYIYNLTLSLRGSETVCQMHKKQDKTVPHECRVCMKE